MARFEWILRTTHLKIRIFLDPFEPLAVSRLFVRFHCIVGVPRKSSASYQEPAIRGSASVNNDPSETQMR